MKERSSFAPVNTTLRQVPRFFALPLASAYNLPMTAKTPKNPKSTPTRLVLVSNREPFQWVQDGLPGWEKTTGGLVAALEPAIRKYGGVWVSGAQAVPEGSRPNLPFQWVPIRYDSDWHQGYYAQFSNRVIWPIFHTMLSPDIYFNAADWNSYTKVNQLFAQHVSDLSHEGDFVWIHDYQLSLLPEMLRALGVAQKSRIGFFLHIPFPCFDLLRVIPWARELLLGMLGADIIGFQNDAYTAHFVDCAERILGARYDAAAGVVRLGHRTVKIRTLPISIDAEQIKTKVSTRSMERATKSLLSDTKGPILVLGVDRLDYTKGLRKRLRALETFFERYPHRRGEVSMIQVAVPSRSDIDHYMNLRDELERQVGHINGLYGTPRWTPVTYMARSLAYDELLALYHAAHIALVTPLRDGMNLVAKEYVAAHPEGGGILVLSELAGAAWELEDAILVNPYDSDGIADALEEALLMPPAQAQKRMRNLNRQVSNNTVYDWIERYLTEALHD